MNDLNADHLMEQDRAEFADGLREAEQVAEDYLDSLDKRPVVPTRAPANASGLPQTGIGTGAALRQFRDDWLPTLVASAGPHWQGYVTGGTTIASIAGDWLAAALDQNVATGEGGAAELERQTIAWVRELLGLPDEQTGVMVTGATTSNLSCLAVAREWVGQQRGRSYNLTGLNGDTIRILSGSAHSSVDKSLSLLGIGRSNLTEIALLPGREAVDLVALEGALRSASTPVTVVANAGTVNSGDFDDLPGLLALRERYPFWLHVDGAFGAFAHLDERCRHFVEGIGEADSVTVDLHKWLNVPYDSAIAFTRHQDLQVSVFHNSSAYQGSPEPVPDFLHLAPENSRRLRALPAWMTLMAYGADGHAEVVRRCNDHARLFAERVADIEGVEVLARVKLNIVCFTTTSVPPGELLDRLTASGEGFLTPTTYFGRPAIRAAFSNWRTKTADVEALVATLRRLITEGGA